MGGGGFNIRVWGLEIYTENVSLFSGTKEKMLLRILIARRGFALWRLGWSFPNESTMLDKLQTQILRLRILIARRAFWWTGQKKRDSLAAVLCSCAAIHM